MKKLGHTFVIITYAKYDKKMEKKLFDFDGSFCVLFHLFKIIRYAEKNTQGH